MKEVYRELGKHFLTLGVAVVTITMLQPIAMGGLNYRQAVLSLLAWLILVILGIILIRRGSE